MSQSFIDDTMALPATASPPHVSSAIARNGTERKRRIAVVVTQLGYGGAERQTVELLRHLKGSCWEPCLVVCLSDRIEPLASELRLLDYRLEALPRRSSVDVARLIRLKRLLRKEGIELVHAVHLLASGYCWVASGFGRSPIVVPSMRGMLHSDGYVKDWVYSRMLTRAETILVNSIGGQAYLHSRFGVPPGRTTLVPNGVDFKAIREAARVRGLRSELCLGNKPTIGLVGRPSTVKNIPRFIDIVSRLFHERDDLHAVLVGEGLDETARSRFAGTLPPSRVHFLGPRRDVPAILGELDALVLTSDSEGCPNVVLEALAVGTSVVGADVGDVSRMVEHGVTGFVIEPTDIAGYCLAITEVLALGSIARQRVRSGWPALEATYDMAKMVDSTVTAWHDCLARAGGRLRNDPEIARL